MIQQSHSGYTANGIKSRISKKYLYSVLIVVLFTITMTWKQTKWALRGEWIKNVHYIHTWNIIQP